ncbi:MAG: DUF3326 domain-containing protein [Candidatus Gastranaerophilales bacterium]|nr:DUF3326 domain-containing protein [Candidatus Gastranaerophilales bacterium]
MNKYDFTAAFIVPTGIGASIGGYAGDASPCLNLISKICPVITNPNTVNAAIFSGINENILYTEGFAIDRFFKEEIALRPSKYNPIGVIFDKAIPEDILNVHINTINAVKTVYGINILGYEITKNEVGVNFSISESGISSGNIESPETLIEAGRVLIDKGAEAIAVVCYFDSSEDNDYSKGEGVDPVGGVEAIISHILTKEFNIPVAHAPAFNDLSISSEIVNPRASAEYITTVFLPCVLLGLYNAPKLVNIDNTNYQDITLGKIKALIVPCNCLGGIPILKAIENNIPVIAVEENTTVINVTAESLGIENKVIKVKNYHEAAGRLLALKQGIYF